jgi:hypothetical protein
MAAVSLTQGWGEGLGSALLGAPRTQGRTMDWEGEATLRRSGEVSDGLRPDSRIRLSGPGVALPGWLEFDRGTYSRTWLAGKLERLAKTEGADGLLRRPAGSAQPCPTLPLGEQVAQAAPSCSATPRGQGVKTARRELNAGPTAGLLPTTARAFKRQRAPDRSRALRQSSSDRRFDGRNG